MKPYSVDLRERVLAAIDRGMARSEVVSTFNISPASLKRWFASRRDTGDFGPRPPSGGPEATFTSALDDELRAQVEAFPDATLPEHAERWNTAHQSTISHWTIGRAIRRLSLSRKKSL